MTTPALDAGRRPATDAPPLPVRVRSALFLVLAALWLIGAGTVALPLLLLPARRGWFAFRIWAQGTMLLLRVVCGQRMEVRGRQNIPTGGAILAAKHMSAWETIALLPLLPHPVYILKRELLRIPIYGTYARHYGMIAVDRDGGASALVKVADAARRAIEEDEAQIVIFPEGTRTPPRERQDYKPGVALLYKSLGRPVVPVAHNSGCYWGTGVFARYPGTVVVSFLPPVPADLPRREFMAALADTIETETDRLVDEAERATGRRF